MHHLLVGVWKSLLCARFEFFESRNTSIPSPPPQQPLLSLLCELCTFVLCARARARHITLYSGEFRRKSLHGARPHYYLNRSTIQRQITDLYYLLFIYLFTFTWISLSTLSFEGSLVCVELCGQWTLLGILNSAKRLCSINPECPPYSHTFYFCSSIRITGLTESKCLYDITIKVVFPTIFVEGSYISSYILLVT